MAVLCRKLFVMYVSIFFSRILANIERNEMGLYEVPTFFVMFTNGYDVSVSQLQHV